MFSVLFTKLFTQLKALFFRVFDVEAFKTVAVQLARITPDVLVATALGLLFLTGTYLSLPAPLQLVFLKVILVSMAFIHAHIVGKLAFPKVDWEWEACSQVMIVRVALYLVFVYAYAVGG